MQEYWLPLSLNFPFKDRIVETFLIRENTYQQKPVSPILRSLSLFDRIYWPHETQNPVL